MAKTKAVASIWTTYRVRWEFLTNICGSVPAAPELIAKWLDARQPPSRPAGGRSIQEINEEVYESVATSVADEDIEQAALLTFQRHEGRVVVRAGTIRAHIKDCARVLSAQYVGRVQGERAFSTRVVNGVYLPADVYWVPVLGEGDTPLATSSGFRDKAVHVKGPRGTFNALKRFEFIEPPTALVFTLQVLGKSITESDLHTLFQYGGTHGYGGERGDGEGRYTYTLEELTA